MIIVSQTALSFNYILEFISEISFKDFIIYQESFGGITNIKFTSEKGGLRTWKNRLSHSGERGERLYGVILTDGQCTLSEIEDALSGIQP